MFKHYCIRTYSESDTCTYMQNPCECATVNTDVYRCVDNSDILTSIAIGNEIFQNVQPVCKVLTKLKYKLCYFHSCKIWCLLKLQNIFLRKKINFQIRVINYKQVFPHNVRWDVTKSCGVQVSLFCGMSLSRDW